MLAFAGWLKAGIAAPCQTLSIITPAAFDCFITPPLRPGHTLIRFFAVALAATLIALLLPQASYVIAAASCHAVAIDKLSALALLVIAADIDAITPAALADTLPLLPAGFAAADFRHAMT
jgi:hypothetical protein